MGLRLSRMRRNVTRIVYNARKNVSATTLTFQVGFDDIFSEPRAVKSGDIGHVLAKPVRKVFSLVFQYSQVSSDAFQFPVKGQTYTLGGVKQTHR